jgi:hypothetical protein
MDDVVRQVSAQIGQLVGLIDQERRQERLSRAGGWRANRRGPRCGLHHYTISDMPWCNALNIKNAEVGAWR